MKESSSTTITFIPSLANLSADNKPTGPAPATITDSDEIIIEVF
jgi:hypothetical protein